MENVPSIAAAPDCAYPGVYDAKHGGVILEAKSKSTPPIPPSTITVVPTQAPAIARETVPAQERPRSAWPIVKVPPPEPPAKKCKEEGEHATAGAAVPPKGRPAKKNVKEDKHGTASAAVPPKEEPPAKKNREEEKHGTASDAVPQKAASAKTCNEEDTHANAGGKPTSDVREKETFVIPCLSAAERTLLEIGNEYVDDIAQGSDGGVRKKMSEQEVPVSCT